MNNPEKSLVRRVVGIYSKRILSCDDCRLLLGDIYQVVESQEKKDLYPFICFYRDWHEHSQLSKNGRINPILAAIENQFSIPESEKSTSDMVAELLSTKSLRKELINFFNLISLSDFPILHSHVQWTDFIGCLCNNLLGKPLKSERFTLVKQLTLEKAKDEQVIWVIETSKPGVKVYGKLAQDEIKRDFLRP